MEQIIKAMTYNIHFTIGTDTRPDWKRIADLIKKENPDVLGLEEVTVNHPYSPGLDVPEAMSGYLGMNIFFGDAIPINNGHGKYGIAALSKYPMEVIDKIFLPVPEGHEKRIFIIVKIQAPKPYYFIVTHFSYQGELEHDEELRTACAKTVTETVQKNHYFPAIWLGDFNTYPGTETLQYIHTQWDVCNDCDPHTPTAHCSHAGWRQIDFICTYPKGAFELREFSFIENILASDHRPVTALLALK